MMTGPRGGGDPPPRACPLADRHPPDDDPDAPPAPPPSPAGARPPLRRLLWRSSWVLAVTGVVVLRWALAPDVGPPDTAPGAGPGGTRLLVVDPDGRPIAGARVRAMDTDATARTDAAGRASLALLQEDTGDDEKGGQRLEVRAPGFARWTGTLPSTTGDALVRVRLEVAAHLSGVVVTPEGDPVPGARVRASRLDLPAGTGVPPHETTVDDEGRFRLDALSPGVWEVAARAPGREVAARTVVASTRYRNPPLRLVARPVGTIVVEVTEPSEPGGDGVGPPAAGATVTLSGSGIWPAVDAETDVRGQARFDGVPAGVYLVRARRGGQQGRARDALELDAGATADVHVALAPGWTVEVAVTDASTAEPVAGAAVVVSDGLGGARKATTGADGIAGFAGLAEPRPRVVATAPGYVPALTRLSPSESPRDDQDPARRRRWDVALLRAGTVTGRVLDPRGQPVPGARVEVVGERADGSPVLHAAGPTGADPDGAGPDGAPVPVGELGVMPGLVPPLPVDDVDPSPGAGPTVGAGASGSILETDEDGRFELPGVPPGELRVVAYAEGHAPGESAAFTLSPGGRSDGVSVELLPAGELTGRVLDAAGFPVAGAPVTGRSELDRRVHRTVTDDDGTFGLRGLAGLVFLDVAPPGRPTHRERVTLPPGRSVDVELRLVGASSRFRGRFLDDRGFPIPGVAVTLASSRPEGRFRRHAVSGGDGTVEIGGLPEPPWRLRAEHSEYATLAVPRLDEDVDEVQLMLSPATALSGRVYDAWTRTPLADAVVELDGEDRTRVTRTRESGRFLFARLPSGPATLTIRSPSHRPLRRAVSVGPRARDLEVLWLEPGGAVSGQVVDRWGTPAAGAEVAPGSPPRWGDAVRVGADGAFLLRGLAPGAVALSARHPRAGTARTTRPVQVRKVEETPGVFLRLPDAVDAAVDEPSTPPSADAPDDDPGARRFVSLAVDLSTDADGVAVARVAPGSTAARAGLRAGDRILSVDGEDVLAAAQARALFRGPAEVPVVLTIERGGRVRTVRAARERVR